MVTLINNDNQKILVKAYSNLRKKMKDLDDNAKAELIQEYVAKEFKNDIAEFTSIAVKLYTYLGYNYFLQTLAELNKIIDVYEELGKYPII